MLIGYMRVSKADKAQVSGHRCKALLARVVEVGWRNADWVSTISCIGPGLDACRSVCLLVTRR